MSQHAIGGTGGAAEATGRGGNGGEAGSYLDSSATPFPNPSDILDGTVKATGGTGGHADGIGGDGGNAVANIEFSSDVASKVTATAEALGGDGTDGGDAGAAIAEASATALAGEASASATAHGGSGGISDSAQARAHATSHGISVAPSPISAEALAIADGGAYNVADAISDVSRGDGTPGSELIFSASAHATSEGEGARGAYTIADYGVDRAVYDPSVLYALAGVVAAPDTAQVASFMADAPNIAEGFEDATSYFAIAQMVGRHNDDVAGTQTASAWIDFSLDLTALADPQNLLIGYDGLGYGFTSLTFTVTADDNVLEDHVWTNLVDAISFFADQYKDYGSVAALDSDGDDKIDFHIAFEIVTGTAGDIFWGSIIIGDPPPQASPADAYELAHAMADHMGTPLESHDAPAPAADLPPVLNALHHDTHQDHFVV